MRKRDIRSGVEHSIKFVSIFITCRSSKHPEFLSVRIFKDSEPPYDKKEHSSYMHHHPQNFNFISDILSRVLRILTKIGLTHLARKLRSVNQVGWAVSLE